MPDRRDVNLGIELFTASLDVARETTRERAIEASGALQLGDSPELQLLVEDARRSFGTAMAAVSIIYRDWQYVLAAVGLPKGVYSRRASLCDHPVTESHRVFCATGAVRKPYPAGVAAEDNRVASFHAGASLLNPDRMALGAFCVFDPKPRAALTGREAVRLRRFADAAMASIGSALAHAPQRVGL